MDVRDRFGHHELTGIRCHDRTVVPGHAQHALVVDGRVPQIHRDDVCSRISVPCQCRDTVAIRLKWQARMVVPDQPHILQHGLVLDENSGATDETR